MTFIFIAYLVVIMGIAVWSARRSKTTDDFILGGKKLGPFSLALSERATGESAWLLLGMTGHAFLEGLSSIWIAVGCVLGILFIWFIMAERLRDESDKTNSMTIPSLFTSKFPGSGKSIGYLSSSIIIFFFFFYIAAQFSGAGKVLYDTFGMDQTTGILIGSLVVTIYTMLGGFITVVATDAFQAVLMIFALVVLPIIALIFAGTIDVNVATALKDAGPVMNSLTADYTGAAAILLILNGLSWMFGYTGQPQLLARMMAMKDKKSVKTARRVAAVWTVLAYFGAVVIGITGFALVEAGALGEHTARIAQDFEVLLPAMILILFSPILAGILLSGVVSAMMSTASSQLMVASSSITEDIYTKIREEKLPDKKLLRINKGVTLSVGLVALILALTTQDTVYGLVSYAWSGIGSSFGPALVLLLFWKKLSRAGVIASLLAGSISTVIWKTWLLEPTGVSERLATYLIAFTLAVFFSLLLPEKKEPAEAEV